MRVVLGMAMAATDPFAYSFFSDNFEPKQLATANSIWTAANFLGAGICALNIILIGAVGWRQSLMITGGAGVALGLFANLMVQEPERKVVAEEKLEQKTDLLKGFKDLKTNPVTKFATIAGSLRNTN